MSEGVGILVISALLLLYGAFSERLSRLSISAPIVFTTAGLALGPAALGVFTPDLKGPAVETLIEAALTLMLFNDAVRVDVRTLRKGAGIPERLLGIGLPLTIVLGALIAWGLFRELAFAELALLAIILAPTDASLGQAVVSDRSIPRRIRQGLNIESGLNDGLAVPLFLVALDAARAVEGSEPGSGIVVVAFEQIGWGALAGVLAGLIGGLIMRVLDGRRFVEGAWRQIIALGSVGAAFGLGKYLGGSVFLGAFVAGVVFGLVAKKRGPGVLHLNEQLSDVLAAAIFFAFGALALGPNLGQITWQVVLYGLLSLTLVRMLPVTIAMARTHARAPTVAFLGWFGPRGLASIVFGLTMLHESVTHAGPILVTIAFTVALSIYLHGLSSQPLMRVYAAWYRSSTKTAGAMMEGLDVEEIRVRNEADPEDG